MNEGGNRIKSYKGHQLRLEYADGSAWIDDTYLGSGYCTMKDVISKAEELKDKRETNCKWCQEDTSNTGTCECEQCWELRSRIQKYPLLTEKIMKSLKKDQERKTNDQAIKF